MRAIATLILLCHFLPACVPSGSTAGGNLVEPEGKAGQDQHDEIQLESANAASSPKAGLPEQRSSTRQTPQQWEGVEPNQAGTTSPERGSPESGLQPRVVTPSLSPVEAREVLWAILSNTETSPELQRERFLLPPAFKQQGESTDQPEAQEEH